MIDGTFVNMIETGYSLEVVRLTFNDVGFVKKLY